MPIITKLGEGKNNKSRISVYLDDEFVCFLNSFSVYKNRLKEGQEIDVSILKDIQMESEKDTAFNLALKYVSKYSKTEKEIKDYILGKGYLPELADYVMQKLKEYNYISDVNFANQFLENSKFKYGKNKIKMLLKQKGISDEILQELQFSSDENALENLARKHLKNKECSFENLQKCAKFLYSRGFDWSEISKVLDKLKTENEIYD